MNEIKPTLFTLVNFIIIKKVSKCIKERTMREQKPASEEKYLGNYGLLSIIKRMFKTYTPAKSN